MGGDNAPQAIMDGVGMALAAGLPSGFQLALVGQEEVVRGELQRIGFSGDPRIEIVHASQVVGMDESAAAAIRSKRDSSLNVAAEMVKFKKAEGMYSAGNTGALVSSAVLRMRTLPGIERPAIAVTMPTTTGNYILVDAGATVECKPLHLVQFAVMGEIYSRRLYNKPAPRVGLLNVGAEEVKGNDLAKEVFGLLKALPGINFIGNVEANDVFFGKADVVVCDGFVGNILLKASEGLSKALLTMIKEEVVGHPLRMVGGMLLKPAFASVKRRTDANDYGGAAVLGLNGVCIKGHGSTKPRGVAKAIEVACSSVGLGLNDEIVRKIQDLGLAPDASQEDSN